MLKAKISEIFYSIQGEGIYMGIPQVFVRFHGCNMSCGFCDTKKESSHAFLSADALVSKILDFMKPYHSLSLTGGEPLLQADFIREFLNEYKKFYRKPIYLETNGTLPKELAKVIEYMDIIAMDFKLPSSTGCRSFWKEHEEFLKIARRKEVFAKAVVTNNTTPEDISRMRLIIKKIKSDLPVVLQPVTVKEKEESLDSDALQSFTGMLREAISHVEIIPQVHKMIGVR